MSIKRVALFLQDLAGGGAERVMINLASGLIGEGVPVDLVLVRARGPYLARVHPAARIVELGTRRTMYSVLALARYLRRERPAALLSALVHVNVASVLAGRLSGTGTRVVVSEHAHPTSDRSGMRLPMIRLAYRLIPWVYPHADRVVAVSRGAAEDLARVSGLPPGRIRVIPNPVVTGDLPARAAEPAGHPWLEPGRPPVVLGVGRLAPQKDFATLLRAFAEVRRRRPARLVILGDGPLRPELEALAGELGVGGDVALPGFVANPYAYMARASVFALSSAWEGFGNVLVEALACGTPVVAADCPSGPCEILDGGRFGRLVPVGDPAALAQAILGTLDRPPDPEVARGRARDFSVEGIAGEYLRALAADGPDGPEE